MAKMTFYLLNNIRERRKIRPDSLSKQWAMVREAQGKLGAMVREAQGKLGAQGERKR